MPGVSLSGAGREPNITSVKTFVEQTKRPLSNYKTLGTDIHVSLFEGLNLTEYKDTRRYVCHMRHNQPCKNCSAMLNVVEKILEEGFLRLKVAFLTVSPNVTYTAMHARRKLLQMPFAAVGVGDKAKE